MWFTWHHNQITLPGIPPAQAANGLPVWRTVEVRESAGVYLSIHQYDIYILHHCVIGGHTHTHTHQACTVNVNWSILLFYMSWCTWTNTTVTRSGTLGDRGHEWIQGRFWDYPWLMPLICFSGKLHFGHCKHALHISCKNSCISVESWWIQGSFSVQLICYLEF